MAIKLIAITFEVKVLYMNTQEFYKLQSQTKELEHEASSPLLALSPLIIR